ncbi:MAG: hypothetical protein ACOC5A_04400, partial [Halanaerobiales bacterium]
MPKMFIYLLIGDTLKSPVTIGKVMTFIVFISIWVAGTTYLKRNYIDNSEIKGKEVKEGEKRCG